ncbi:MAG: winged helix DNA-binding domain-containing protein [Candidatus Saccharibacteria bacterium]
MTTYDIAPARLQAQDILHPNAHSVHDVVASMGAMQAQDYGGALWSIGLRMVSATVSSVEDAIASRQIIRTWPMRGTLHVIPAEDAQWMLTLLTPRVMRSAASREQRLELNDAIYARCFAIFRTAMSGGKAVLRSELLALLDAASITTASQRGYHILWRAAQEGLICFGPMQGKQPTFVLLEEWAPKQRQISSDEALAELARRYVTSHGPTTERDFAGWAGLSLTEARTGIAASMAEVRQETIDGTAYLMPRDMPLAIDEPSVFLLPGFDEFMLGYKDRSAALHVDHAQKIVPGNNGMFLPTVILDGQVRGTWKRVLRKTSVAIQPIMFDGHKLSPSHERLLHEAADRYAAFLGVASSVVQ